MNFQLYLLTQTQMLVTDFYVEESIAEYQPIEEKQNVEITSHHTLAPKVTIQLSDLFNTYKPVQPMKLFKCEYCLKLYRNEHNLNVHRETCRK